MFKKIYIYTGNLEKSDELNKFSFLFGKSRKEIWKYSMKSGKNIEGKIYDVAVLEIFLFYSYLLEKGYKKNKIEFIKEDDSLFIYNEHLYRIIDSDIEELNLDNVGFFALRTGKINKPFFFILKKIIEKKGGKFSRTNNINNLIYGKGKFYSLYDLYENRKEFLGDIIIPYNIKGEKKVGILMSIIKNNFSNIIVLKKNFGFAGENIYVVDLRKNEIFQNMKFKKVVEDFNNDSYILPYYNFKDEFRFYFTKKNNNINIYSVKRKIILSDIDEITSYDNFKYFKNIKLKWLYLAKKDYLKYKNIFDFAYEAIQKLNFDTGTFECGVTEDNKIIFFEVNPMSAAICFEGEDEKNMDNYYIGVFNNLLN